MTYKHRIVFSLLLSTFASTQSAAQNERQYKLIKTKPLYEIEIPEDINSTPLKQHPEQIAKADIFTEEDIEEMGLVFESSPKEAQCIVNHLQDPTFFPGNKDYRAAYFVGEPGSGKTIMAQSIAYKMAQEGWEYKIIPSTSFVGKYRNQTAIQLRKELEAIESSNKPTILIIDELNRLLENAGSKNHDTDVTSTVLWTFLDKQKNNQNFFLIGTMNRITKLPKPFKDRILFDYITFQPIIDSEIQKKTFFRYLAINHTVLDPEVTGDFLSKELEKLGPCSARNLKKISKIISRTQSLDDPHKTDPLIIKKVSITKAISIYIERKKEAEYDLEEETDAERQERHHRENIHLQQKHHAEQMLLQKENQNMQEQHFVQQQRIQAVLACYQDAMGRTFFLDHNAAVKKIVTIVDNHLSPDQKTFFNAMLDLNQQIAEQNKNESK